MTGVGRDPRNFDEFVVDTRRRLVTLERRQNRATTTVDPGTPDPTVQTATLDPPYFRAHMGDGTQTTTNGGASPTYTSVTLYGGWTQNGTLFVAPRDGQVYASAQAGIESTTTTVGNNYVAIWVNGASRFQSASSDSDRGSSGNDYYRTAGLIEVSAGDTLEMRVRTQISGASYQASEDRTFFHAYYVEGEFDITTDSTVIAPAIRGAMIRTSTVSWPNSAAFVQDTDFDTYQATGNISAGSNQITIQQEGTYLVTSNMSYSSNATGRRNHEVRLNGLNIPDASAGALWLGFSGNTNSFPISFTYYFNVGDVLTKGGWQNSGAALDSAASEVIATLIAPATGTATTVGVEDSGWITAGIMDAPNANWNLESQAFRKINGVVEGFLVFSRVGSTLDFTTGGSFGFNNAFLSDDWKPAHPVYMMGNSGGTATSPFSEGTLESVMLTSGAIQGNRTTGNFGQISTGNYIGWSFTYMTA